METELEKKPVFFRFEDLRIYHKTLDYTKWVMLKTSNFNSELNIEFAKNFIKSASSMAMQIAEGTTRNKVQFINYLKLSKSLVRECIVYTSIAEKLYLFSESDVNESRELLMEITKMLNALISSLLRQNSSSAQSDEDDIE